MKYKTLVEQLNSVFVPTSMLKNLCKVEKERVNLGEELKNVNRFGAYTTIAVFELMRLGAYVMFAYHISLKIP